MDGLKKLHEQQDEFIKNTLQADKIINQPMFDSYEQKMEQTKVKVKKYSYKQQRIIILLLLLLAISVGFNIYQAFIKEAPVNITNIFEPGENSSTSNKEKENNSNIETEKLEEVQTDEQKEETTPTNTVENIVENTSSNTISSTIEIPTNTVIEEPINTTLTPELFTNVNTNEIEDFVEQFAIGINKLDLNNNSNLESNTILLYIAQQYFSAKSNNSTSLTVDTTYASSAENFHKFLSEFTIHDYSTIDYLKSYNNYIGYVSRSKSYIYGKDYSVIGKEKYTCDDVSISNEKDNVYTATAKVTRDYDGDIQKYDITFTFKVNGNYKYQKYKLLTLNSKLTSGKLESIIHLVGN